MTAQTIKLVTADELLDMSDIGRCELINGEIIHMPPSGAEHGRTAIHVGARIWSFLRTSPLGEVYAAETGFLIARDPDTVRAPDVAFVRNERVPVEPFRRYFPGAPDLAVEVVSPNDRLTEVLDKADRWLASGAISVWIVDPARRSIDIYRAGGVVLRYRDHDEVRDEPTLPGFVLKLSDVFGSTEAQST
jgi:Uma2 family endonuclease